MATGTQNIGHITQVIGSTFDAQFDEDKLPAIYNAVKIESNHKGVEDQSDRRSAAAPGRRSRSLCGPGRHRRPDPRTGLRRYRRTGIGARR